MRSGRLLYFSLFALSCTSSQPPPKTQAHARTEAARPRAPLPPPSPDVSREIMGWVVIGDGAPLMRAVGDAMHVDVGDQPADALRLVAAELLGIHPSLTGALDLKRPMAAALLNPSLLKGTDAQPVLALLPVKDRAAVERGVLGAKMKFATTPWGLAVATPAGTAFVAFEEMKPGGLYAKVAFRPELVQAAAAVLAPALRERTEPLVVHLSFENVYAWYGPQLDAMLAQMSLAEEAQPEQPKGGAVDPQVIFATRSARQLARFARSVRALDLLVSSDDDGLRVTAQVDGKPDGEWAGYVASQESGPVWGTRLVPPDAVLVYATHRSAGWLRSEMDAAVEYMGDTARPRASAERRAGWRTALDGALAQLAGEAIYAIWPGREGGIGLGGALRTRDGGSARPKVLAAYRKVGTDMAGLVGRALELDPRRYGVAVKVSGGAARIAGAPVDTVEVTIRWPEGADDEKQRFAALFGDKLVLGFAYVGDAVVFALGHDWRSRLGAMVAAARGVERPSLADNPEFARALAFCADGRVSLTYLPTAPMARFLAHLMLGTKVPGTQVAAAGGMLPTPPDAIISTTNASGARYEVTTRLPASSLPDLFNVGGVLWRIALAPLINPPAVLPLPIPPAHVTPHKPRTELRLPFRR